MRKMRMMLVPVVAGVLGLAVTAAPASAATGSGTYQGTATFTNTLTNPPPNVCFYTTASLTTAPPPSTNGASGNFSDGTHSYSGAVTITYDYHYYMNAYHTYTDSTCTTQGPGVVTSASITGGSGSNTVSCQWTSGTFVRNTDPNTNVTNETVNLPASAGSCSIDGGASSPTHILATGSFGACIPATAPPPPSQCQENYSYNAYNT